MENRKQCVSWDLGMGKRKKFLRMAKNSRLETLPVVIRKLKAKCETFQQKPHKTFEGHLCLLLSSDSSYLHLLFCIILMFLLLYTSLLYFVQ